MSVRGLRGEVAPGDVDLVRGSGGRDHTIDAIGSELLLIGNDASRSGHRAVDGKRNGIERLSVVRALIERNRNDGSVVSSGRVCGLLKLCEVHGLVKSTVGGSDRHRGIAFRRESRIGRRGSFVVSGCGNGLSAIGGQERATLGSIHDRVCGIGGGDD